MRCVAGKEWGADRSALKEMYTSLIRSVFDFGSIAYSSTSKSLLRKLDSIQAQALRICCGAFRTTHSGIIGRNCYGTEGILRGNQQNLASE